MRRWRPLLAPVLFAILTVILIASGGTREAGGSAGSSTVFRPPPQVDRSTPSCLSAGRFKGKQWWKANQTLAVETLAESPFGRVQMHTVRGEDGRTWKNWMWWDERDHVNVLVRLAASRKFLVFRQSKYGFEGESLATVGGYVEPDEEPLAAAVREINEELGLKSSKWTRLGTYRTASNRGAGWFSTFFADDCVPVGQGLRKGSDDLEGQTRVEMTRSELTRAVLDGQFVEVKWSATVALTLLGLPDDGDGGGAVAGAR